MFNNKLFSIMKRELRDKLMSKTFIISTLLLPVFMFGIIGIQSALISYGGDEGTTIEIVTESDLLTNKFAGYMSELEFVKDSSYLISYYTLELRDIDEYIDVRRIELSDGNLSGLIYIPNSSLLDKQVTYYSNTPSNHSITERLDGHVNKVLLDEYFKSREISDDELAFVRKRVDIKSFKVSEDEDVETEGIGNQILAFIFTFLLYISLLMMGQMTMQSVLEEKSSKIVEILLSSVSSNELMSGKIIGTAIMGAVQMIIWLSPVIVLVTTAWFALPPELTVDITIVHLIYFIFNYFLGLLIYLGLFATVGAIFDNAQEAQSGVWPIMLSIMIPFFISLSLMRNPTNPIGEIASLIPFATIIVMPTRITSIDIPAWQIILSILINFATILVLYPIVGKIYRIGILRTGKKPKWSEIVKWIRYKY
jgi:ABC-2 type transport system permease protein